MVLKKKKNNNNSQCKEGAVKRKEEGSGLFSDGDDCKEKGKTRGARKNFNRRQRRSELRSTSGFFSQCGDVMKSQLRESRAALLVARNKRELAEEERKLKQLDSPIAHLKDTVYCVNLADRFRKKEGDSHVVGWARTVAEGYAETIAKSAPSSVPSLESVPFDVELSSVERKKQHMLKLYRGELAQLEKDYDDGFEMENSEYDAIKAEIVEKYQEYVFDSHELRAKKEKEKYVAIVSLMNANRDVKAGALRSMGVSEDEVQARIYSY